MKMLSLASAVLATIVLVACDGESDPFEEAVEIRELNIASLSVVGPTITVDKLYLNIGESVDFTVQGTNTAAQTVELSAANRLWQVTEPEFATISDDGRLVATGNGDVGVYVTIGGLDSDVYQLTVSDANLSGISSISGDESVDRCIPADYQATGEYDDGTIRDLTSVNWTLAAADEGFASIVSNPDITVTLTGLNDGGVTLTAEVDGISLAYDVSISDTLSSIAITPDTATVAVGGTQSFVATGVYTEAVTDEGVDTNRVAITESVNWQVSDSSLASVSNTQLSHGQLTGVAVGGLTLTASCGDLSASTPAIVTVEEGEDELSFNLGTFYQLSADSSGVFLRVSPGTSYSASDQLDNDDLDWELTTDDDADPIELEDDGDNAGLIKPLLSSGQATITVTDSSGNTATIDIEVVDN